jgi:hypothetical protein
MTKLAGYPYGTADSANSVPLIHFRYRVAFIYRPYIQDGDF